MHMYRSDQPMSQFKVERNYYGNIYIYEYVRSQSVQGFTWKQVALHQYNWRTGRTEGTPNV